MSAILIAPTILQSTAFAGLLLAGRAPGHADRLLACLFAVHALSASLTLVPDPGDNQTAASLVAVGVPLAFLYGPLTFAYVATVLGDACTTRRSIWSRPQTFFSFGLILALPIAAALHWEGPLETSPFALPIALLAAALLPAYFIVNATFLVRAGWRTLRGTAGANASPRELTLARRFVAIVTLGWITGFLADLPNTLSVQPVVAADVAAWIELLCALSVGIIALHHRWSAHPRPAKYARSILPETEAKRLKRKLDIIMAEERAYRDPALSLSRLAHKVGCPPHRLTHLLAADVQRPYCDYVNAWRIAEACERLRKGEETILSISLAVGFNSRSTFNAAFKKHTGLTPTAYRAGGHDIHVATGATEP